MITMQLCAHLSYGLTVYKSKVANIKIAIATCVFFLMLAMLFSLLHAIALCKAHCIYYNDLLIAVGIRISLCAVAGATDEAYCI